MCEYCGGWQDHEIGCPLFDYSAYPQCAECGGAIFGSHYNINGHLFHTECINHLHNKEICDLAGKEELIDEEYEVELEDIIEYLGIEVAQYVE